MILEILEVLPELMNEEKVVIEDEVRSNFVRFAMESLQTQVLQTLSQACAVPDMNTRKRYQLINCFHAWMIDQTTELVKEHLHELNLLNLCYEELKLDGENNGEAADAIVACMVICKDSSKYQHLYGSIINGLFGGKAHFLSFVRDGKEEEVHHYITVYSVLVSRIFDQILMEPRNEAIQFMLEGVFLKVMQENKREMVSKTTTAITSIIKKLQTGDDASHDKLAKINTFIQIYLPWFEAIIEAACEHCRLAPVRFFYSASS